MTTDTKTPDKPELARPPFYRDVRVIRVVSQLAAVGAVLGLLAWLVGNLFTNMNALGISTSFDFLGRPTNTAIPFDTEFDPRSPVRDLILIGVKNTFLAGIFGIVLASIVGLLVGISRLSENWLLARLATGYVEFFRNIPPLVIIIFVGAAVFTFGAFPIFSESWEFTFPGSDDNFLIVNNDRWGIPGFTGTDSLAVFWGAMVFGVVVGAFAWYWRTKRFERTGQPHHRVLWFLGVVLASMVIGFFLAGQPFEMSWPAISENRRRIDGGFIVNWGFMSITVALGLYTASHIGEIIRGSILAVPKGQSEAANSVALTAFQRYRYVVLPQAMRIALPPTINQYLNLVKNTSLGVAVGYADLTNLTQTSVGNGRPAFQSFIIIMGVYLTFSLTISFVLNIVNRRIQLVAR